MQRWMAIVVLTLACTAGPCLAVRIADITRLGGQRSNVITGLGLVVGLRGTGDGGDYLAAIKPLAMMLSKYSNAVTPKDLTNAQNVAVVGLSATIPPEGVRDGDRIDVYVMSLGKASSLKNGRLFMSPMLGPTAQPIPGTDRPFAMAEGFVEIEGEATPTVGLVKKGAVMETDLEARTIDEASGQFELILDGPSANYTTASAIAKIINEAADSTDERTALVRDAKTVVVTIPRAERERPDAFISRIQRLPVSPLLLAPEARVVVNTKLGSIVLTGDVEISPVVISHKGLTIATINPPPKPTERVPITTERNAVAVDTTGTGGAKLQDLVTVFDQLKVPTEDRIIILKELHKTGKLHAKLILE